MKLVGKFCERCGAAVGRDAFCKSCKADYYAQWKAEVDAREKAYERPA